MIYQNVTRYLLYLQYMVINSTVWRRNGEEADTMVIAKWLYRPICIKVKIIIMILWFIHKIWTLNAGCVDAVTIRKQFKPLNIYTTLLYFFHLYFPTPVPTNLSPPWCPNH